MRAGSDVKSNSGGDDMDEITITITQSELYALQVMLSRAKVTKRERDTYLIACAFTTTASEKFAAEAGKKPGEMEIKIGDKVRANRAFIETFPELSSNPWYAGAMYLARRNYRRDRYTVVAVRPTGIDVVDGQGHISSFPLGWLI
jgi:hypothetical protein